VFPPRTTSPSLSRETGDRSGAEGTTLIGLQEWHKADLVAECGETEVFRMETERVALGRQHVVVEEQLRPIIEADERFLDAC